MANASPFQPAELERALGKLTKHEPLTREEHTLVRRTLDEAPIVDPTPEHDRVRKLLGLSEGEALPAEILDQIAWREANVDNPDPVLRAIARAPLADEPMPADVRLACDQAVADIRAGRVQPIAHEEVMRELARRQSAAT